jgi:signal transduction histidine kinase
VEDQGPGIDPRDHEQVFRRFWSADGSSIGGEDRSGLGLAIVRQVAESHGGLVTLRSELGTGAEFVIWLPASPTANRDTVTADGVHPRIAAMSQT